MRQAYKNSSAVLFALLLMTLSVNAALAQTIKKCQDAEGKWHYGDIAAEECARSKITEINSQGIKVKENQPPASAEQLEAERQAKFDQQQLKQQQQIRDQKRAKLLSTFESEQSIIQARDDRFAAIDREVTAFERLQSRLRIQRDQLEQDRQSAAAVAQKTKIEDNLVVIDDQLVQYRVSLADKQRQRDQVDQKYNNLLNDYRAIKGN